MGLTVTPVAKQQISVLGYDPVYGARPLRRAIQRHIENPASSLIIKEGVKAGETLTVDFDGNEFVFNVERPVGLEKEVPLPVSETKKYVCLDCGKEFELPVIAEPAQPFEPPVSSGSSDSSELPADRQGLPDLPDSSELPAESAEKVDSPYAWESTETSPAEIAEVEEKPETDIMAPQVAAFMDDPAQPLEEKPDEVNPPASGLAMDEQDLQQKVNDQLGSTEPTMSDESFQPSVPPEVSDVPDTLDTPNASGMPETQVVCPHCGGTNVRLKKEAAGLPARLDSAKRAGETELLSPASQSPEPSSPTDPSVSPEEESLRAFYGTEESSEPSEEPLKDSAT